MFFNPEDIALELADDLENFENFGIDSDCGEPVQKFSCPKGGAMGGRMHMNFPVMQEDIDKTSSFRNHHAPTPDVASDEDYTQGFVPDPVSGQRPQAGNFNIEGLSGYQDTRNFGMSSSERVLPTFDDHDEEIYDELVKFIDKNSAKNQKISNQDKENNPNVNSSSSRMRYLSEKSASDSNPRRSNSRAQLKNLVCLGPGAGSELNSPTNAYCEKLFREDNKDLMVLPSRPLHPNSPVYDKEIVINAPGQNGYSQENSYNWCDDDSKPADGPMEEFEKSFTLNMDAQQSEVHVSPKGMDMLIENGGFDFGQKNQEFLLLHEELYKNQSYSEEFDSPDHDLVAYIKENEHRVGPNSTTEENLDVPVPRG